MRLPLPLLQGLCIMSPLERTLPHLLHGCSIMSCRPSNAGSLRTGNLSVATFVNGTLYTRDGLTSDDVVLLPRGGWARGWGSLAHYLRSLRSA